MLTNLQNIKFIGDLSLEDADILAGYARNARSILEFGAGGSTQIFAQFTADHIISVETDQSWITLTETRLKKLDKIVDFIPYTTQFNQTFDMIFVDGVDHLRRDFAIETWKYLKSNGIMVFHDTRRFQDFQNAAWIAQLYFNEIKRIDVNAPASNGATSNMTILHKKQHEPYVNWNDEENKPEWAYGRPDGEDHELWEYK
jgi:spermidine synthase